MLENQEVEFEIAGGLGNQLFQLCIALQVQRFGFQPVLNVPAAHIHSTRDYRKYMSSLTSASTKLFPGTIHALGGRELQLAANPLTRFDARTYHTQPALLLNGYFQHKDNVLPVLDHLRSEFLGAIAREVQPAFTDLSGFAFIHVRRGDYLKHPTLHWIQGMEYYRAGMERLRAHGVRRWLLASDDMEWCKAQEWPIQEGEELRFLDEPDELRTLLTLSDCKAGAILGNSTFSWWAAMFGTYRVGGPVVYPTEWFGTAKPDLFPNGWVGLNRAGHRQ
jgi:hypothetical protein